VTAPAWLDGSRSFQQSKRFKRPLWVAQADISHRKANTGRAQRSKKRSRRRWDDQGDPTGTRGERADQAPAAFPIAPSRRAPISAHFGGGNLTRLFRFGTAHQLASSMGGTCQSPGTAHAIDSPARVLVLITGIALLSAGCATCRRLGAVMSDVQGNGHERPRHEPRPATGGDGGGRPRSSTDAVEAYRRGGRTVPGVLARKAAICRSRPVHYAIFGGGGKRPAMVRAPRRVDRRTARGPSLKLRDGDQHGCPERPPFGLLGPA